MILWEDWQLWCCLGAACFLLAYLSATEAAFLAVNDVRVKHRAEGGDARALFLAGHLDDREGLLSFLLLAAQFASCLLALALLRLLADVSVDFPRAVILVLCTSAFVQVFFQRLPAVAGARYADRLAVPLAWPLRHLERPPLSFLQGMNRMLIQSTGRFLGAAQAGVDPGYKFDEIRLLLEASESQGVLDRNVHRMLQATFGLAQIPVRRAMLPLEDTAMVSAEAPVLEAARQAGATGFSRLPIFQGERSQVIGYVHVLDLLVGAARDPERPAQELKQEILQLRRDDSLVTALRLFRSSRYHMAAVVDGEGSAARTVGVLTIEDVLEHIVGDIEDEHDAVAGGIHEAGPGRWVTDPHCTLVDLEASLGVVLPDGRYQTLGGFLSSRLGESWRRGGEIDVPGFSVTVEEGERLGVPRILLHQKPREDPE